MFKTESYLKLKKISNITNSTKNIKKNSAFFAIKGSNTDGNKYISEAIKQGAKIIISNNKKEFMIESLIERIKLLDIEEVIIATSVTIDGQTTAYYIQDSLKSSNVKISKLAQGIPIGGELENLDDGTLVSAFKNRKNINI